MSTCKHRCKKGMVKSFSGKRVPCPSCNRRPSYAERAGRAAGPGEGYEVKPDGSVVIVSVTAKARVP